MDEYASIRFTDSWRPAMRFATVIVSTASVAKAGGQPVPHDVNFASPKQSSSTRSNIAKAADFTATAMKLIAGVGAPSYASGAHMWKGTALILNARPTSTSANAKSTSGSGSFCVSESALPMAARSVVPVTP